MKTIFSANLSVDTAGNLTCYTMADHSASFEDIKAAMIKARDELSRLIEQGPSNCPYKGHIGTISDSGTL